MTRPKQRFTAIILSIFLISPYIGPGLVAAQEMPQTPADSTGTTGDASTPPAGNGENDIPNLPGETVPADQNSPAADSQTDIQPIINPEAPAGQTQDNQVIQSPVDQNTNPDTGDQQNRETPLSSLDDASGSNPLDTPTVQRVQGVIKSSGNFDADLFSGSAIYNYQFNIPQGRQGLTPILSLRYNSSQRNQLGSSGLRGWSFEVGHIERTNKTGVNNLFSTSSVPTFIIYSAGGGGSAELVPLELQADGIHGTYGAKTEQDFSTINFQTDNSWTVLDHNGNLTTYGATLASREYDPDDANKVSSWYISDVVTATGATMDYLYARLNNALTVSNINYGGQKIEVNEETGPFEIDFTWANSADQGHSYQTGYLIQRTKALTSFQVKVDTIVRQEYFVEAQYTGSNGTGKSITGIREVKYSAEGVATTLPYTNFTYQPVTAAQWDSVSATTTENVFPLNLGECVGDNVVVCNDRNEIADINGDGKSEVISIQPEAGGGTDGFHVASHVYSLQPDGSWSDDTSWETVIPPVGTGSEPSYGKLHFTDVNGDGLVDIAISVIRTENNINIPDNRVYLNNGHGWDLSGDWQIPYDNAFVDLFLDVNGDGLPDFVTSTAVDTGELEPVMSSVYLNNGHGWTLDSSWVVPLAIGRCITNNFSCDGSLITDPRWKIRPFDVNNDGLVDFVNNWFDSNNGGGGGYHIFINNGHGWIESDTAQWGDFPYWYCRADSYGGCSAGAKMQLFPGDTQIMDFNQDGVDDVVRSYDPSSVAELHSGVINNQFSTVSHNLPALESSTGDRGVADKYRFGDFNGDGQTDIGWGFYNNWIYSSITDYRRYIRNNQPDYLLSSITEPTGAITNLEYKEAHQYYDANNQLLNPNLPLPVWTLNRVSTNPVQSPAQITSYEYKGGAVAFASTTDKDFAGFWQVTATSGNQKAITEFYQGLQGLPFTTSTQLHADRGQFEDMSAKRGRVYRTETLDTSSNQIISSEITKWLNQNLSGSGRAFVYPQQTTAISFKQDGTPDATAVEKTFDLNNGNELSQFKRGSVEADINSGEIISELGTDQATEETQYANGVATHVLGAPMQKNIKNIQQQVIAQKQICYDNLTLGQVLSGKPTRMEDFQPSSVVQASYDDYANVIRTVDPRGNSTTYAFDPTYHLVAKEVTNAIGQTTRQAIDLAIGQVTSSTDPNGSKQQMTYDGFGRPLARYINKPNGTDLVLAETWVYNDTIRPIQVYHQSFVVVNNPTAIEEYSYADGLGRTIQTRKKEIDTTYLVADTGYNDQGKISWQSLPYRQDGSLYTAADHNQPGTSYVYDAAGRVISIHAPAGTTMISYDGLVSTITDAAGRSSKYEYDGLGRLIKQTRYIQGRDIIYVYDWDAAGRLIKITDPAGNDRDFTYDGLGRLLTQTDWHNQTTPIVAWRYVYDAAGNKLSQTDPRGQIIRYTYDSLNRLVSEDDHDNRDVDVRYYYDSSAGNGVGRLSSFKAKGVITTYGYDKLGNVTNLVREINKDVYSQTYNYNLLGQLINRTEPDGTTVFNSYDKAGRWLETSTTMPGKGPKLMGQAISYTPLGQLEYLKYGSNLSNGNNLVTVDTYTPADDYRLAQRLTGQVPPYDGLPHTVTTTSTSTAASLAFDRSQYVEVPDSSSLDLTGDMTIEAWVKSPGLYAWNQALMILMKGTSGNNYDFYINENNNIAFGFGSHYVYCNDSFNQSEQPQWQHMAVAYNNTTRVARFYRNGVLECERTFETGNPLPNSEQLLIGKVPGGQYNFGFQGNLADIRLWNTARTQPQIQDNKDRRLNVTETGLVAYWPTDELTSSVIHDHSGQNNLGTFNPIHPPTWSTSSPVLMNISVSTTPPTPRPIPINPLQNISYAYDAIGNVTSVNDQSTFPLGKNISYAYDELDRLVKLDGNYASSGPVHEEYVYDDLGNLTGQSNNSHKYIFDNNPYRPNRLNLEVGDPIVYNWDAAGNLTDYGDKRMEYDSYNNLTAVQYGDQRDSFVYDQSGNRITKATRPIINNDPNLQSTTTYIGSTYEKDSNGTIRKFIDIPGRRLAVITTSSTGETVIQYLHPDILGSAHLTTNEQGNPAWANDNNVYGSPRIDQMMDQGGIAPTKTFTGKEQDSSDLFYFGARYYDPNLLRFTQIDPVILSLGQSLSQDLTKLLLDPRRLHPYAYAANNPTKYVDDSGNSFTLIGAAVGAVAGMAWAAPDIASFLGNTFTGNLEAASQASSRMIAKAGAGLIAGAAAGAVADVTIFSLGTLTPQAAATAGTIGTSAVVEAENVGTQEAAQSVTNASTYLQRFMNSASGEIQSASMPMKQKMASYASELAAKGETEFTDHAIFRGVQRNIPVDKVIQTIRSGGLYVDTKLDGLGQQNFAAINNGVKVVMDRYGGHIITIVDQVRRLTPGRYIPTY